MVTITNFENGPYYEPLWGGDTDNIDIQSDNVASGSYALEMYDSSVFSGPGAATTRDFIVSRSSTPIEATVYFGGPDTQSEFLFGVQSVADDGSLSCYAFGGDQVNAIQYIARCDSGSKTRLTETTTESLSGWETLSIDTWDSNGNIDISIGGDTISAVDDTYSSGGIGINANQQNRVGLDTVTADSFTDNRFAAPTNVSVTEN